MFNILYTITIGPLKLLFEIIFSLAYYITNNAGISIVFLSVAINVLILPLYLKADDIQNKQSEIEQKLKPGINHIKKTFKGDEQYMVLSTYYRQNHYKQTDALKSSISLLLQIPFFIAAYDFLSDVTVLGGSSFGPIVDLGKPDALITIGKLSINILPVAMTLINIISSIVYSKGKPIKDRLQLYILAIVFLIFLYSKPSGLTFYWTLNNIFSFAKNIVMKSKKSRLVTNIICSTVGIACVLCVIIKPLSTLIQKIIVLFLGILLQFPLVLSYIIKSIEISNINNKVNNDNRIFIFACIFLTVFVGAYIPSTVIVSSPGEFVSTISLNNPISYVTNTFALAVGIFMVWFYIYYYLMNKQIKGLFEKLLITISLISIVDYFFFGTNTGRISNILIYDEIPSFSTISLIINLLTIVMIIVLFVVFYRKIEKVMSILFISLICVILLLSTINSYKIHQEASNRINNINESNSQIASINLSKDNQNVVVIILDRAINSYFPYLLQEDPKLQKQYAGFTYYPNTLSYGDGTIIGIPSVYGGYEYSPEKINKRENISLANQYNDALKLMPELFAQEDYDVTVFDPSVANANFEMDTSIYNYNNNIKAYNTTLGMFKIDGIEFVDYSDSLNRNLLCYSIMKISPLVMRNMLYNYGAYLSIDNYNYIWSEDIAVSKYTSESFINAFAVLKNMINITNVESKKSNFLLMYNPTTHEETILQEPEYEITNYVDNTEYEKEHKIRTSIFGNSISIDTRDQLSHYCSNMASIKQIGNWLDYLRENDVYDNTRIIIVADHGIGLNSFEEWHLNDNGENFDLMKFNPLLLYKDFNSDEFTTNKELMFNADTLSLAINGIIENAVNPFTGYDLNKKVDKTSEKVFVSNRGTQIENGKIANGYWYTINGNIFEVSNWKEVR